jgi:hypothetical protein
MVQTCTAVYAIARGVTVVKPISEATSERVAVDDFLGRFAAGASSISCCISSVADDGDVNIDLNAYEQVKVCLCIKNIENINNTFTKGHSSRAPSQYHCYHKQNWRSRILAMNEHPQHNLCGHPGYKCVHCTII